MAFDIEQGNDPVLQKKTEDLKQRVANALMATGHATEKGLAALAAAAVAVLSAEVTPAAGATVHTPPATTAPAATHKPVSKVK